MLNLEASLSRVKWDLNNKCNLNCRHCMLGGGGNPYTQSHSEERNRVLMAKKIADFGAKEVIFQSMEPLLSPDIYELLAYFSARNIVTGVLTNGILLTEDNINRLIDCGVKYVAISLDGITAESHDYIRGLGTFNTIVHNIRKLVQIQNERGTKIRIVISMCLHSKNVDEAKDFPRFFEGMGVDVVNVGALALIGKTKWGSEMLITREQVNKAYVEMYQGYKKIEKPSFTLFPKSLMPFETRFFNTIFDLRLPVHIPSCSVGRGVVGISDDGILRGCNFAVNDISQRAVSVMDIFTRADLGKIVKENESIMNDYVTLNSEINSHCLSCEFSDRCKYCPIGDKKCREEDVLFCNEYREKLSHLVDKNFKISLNSNINVFDNENEVRLVFEQEGKREEYCFIQREATVIRLFAKEKAIQWESFNEEEKCVIKNLLKKGLLKVEGEWCK